jgi:hypothetical protein
MTRVNFKRGERKEKKRKILPIITCQATKHMSRLLRERMPRGIQ